MLHQLHVTAQVIAHRPSYSERFLYVYQRIAVSMLELQYYPLISEATCHSIQDNGFAANRSSDVPRLSLPRSAIDRHVKI